MIVKRPSRFIYTNAPNKEYLKEICAGIEEEGVFFEVFEKEASELDDLVFDAAADSMLGSGIGICGDHVALQMRGISKGKNIESYRMPTPAECRKIGANSARVIKKMPLK